MAHSNATIRRNRWRSLLGGVSLLIISGLQAVALGDDTDLRARAREILDATEIKGGLIVHLGCGDGRLTAALRAGEQYLVQGLDPDADQVARAREYLHEHQLYGLVSIDHLAGERLPYVDNLVNLVVAEDLGAVPHDEVMRVLCPKGAVYLKKDGRWTKTVKALPSEIDEWTHFLYDATNNAVSNDFVVGPPKQLQWIGDPKWQRSHDHLASVSAAVSSGGRIFYIVDEGPIAAVVLQPRWKLVARDAFNGMVLWKRTIPDWQYHLRGFRSGPSELARRLVAVDERVYVTLGIDAPISVLDAATGETIMTFEGTEDTQEFVCSQEKLFVVTGDVAAQQAAAQAKRRGARPGLTDVRTQRPAFVEVPPPKGVAVRDVETGNLLWQKRDADTADLMPSTLAAAADRVFLQNADELICLDATTGAEFWRAERPVSRSRPTWSAPTLVVYDDVVLSADRKMTEKRELSSDDQRKVEWIVSSRGGQAPVGELIAFSIETGERLWSTSCKECYNAPVDVLVAGGLVWTGSLVSASEPGITRGLDPKTGEVKRTRPIDQTFFTAGMSHGRCYRNKATNQYLVLGRSGVEFIDVVTGEAAPHHWTRGTCQYGVIPCNGLLYVTPHTCACFIRSKLSGFNCYAPGRTPIPEMSAARRLEQGPAFSSLDAPDSSSPDGSDWPSFRHDAARSGATETTVAAQLRPAWHVSLGGKLSSPVIADGKLFVARHDTHTVHAINAEDGSSLWSYSVGGTVDSPPTFCEGRVYFGSADGWVYCLRARDGALGWRYRAAPTNEQIVARGRLESAWPVHGSVLVRDGNVYCAAGRSSYLDGGIRLVRLDAIDGQELSETVIDHRDPATGFQLKGQVNGTNMPGALPDILSSDGESVFMRHTRFDLSGTPQPPDVPHLFSAAGFLEDDWWHRNYTMIGTMMATNYGGWPNVGSRVPAGRLLVMDDETVYGFGRSQYIHHGAHVGIDGATVFHFRPDRDSERRFTHYQAFAIRRQPEAGPPSKATTDGDARRRAPQPKKLVWNTQLPVLARALVLAQDTLFFGGPPDIFQSDDPHAAWNGQKGGVVLAISAADGRELGRLKLESPPVFDGMAAANGRLFTATVNGTVLCLEGR